MNKQLLVFIAAFSLSTMHVCAVSEQMSVKKHDIVWRKAQVRKLYSSYLASLILSGCVGATTGGLVRYMEKRLDIESSPVALLLLLLGWAFESEFRNDIIIDLQKELDSYQVDHKKGLMFKSAWIASWLAYLQS